GVKLARVHAAGRDFGLRIAFGTLRSHYPTVRHAFQFSESVVVPCSGRVEVDPEVGKTVGQGGAKCHLEGGQSTPCTIANRPGQVAVRRKINGEERGGPPV